jgi:hypothetical protein
MARCPPHFGGPVPPITDGDHLMLAEFLRTQDFP